MMQLGLGFCAYLTRIVWGHDAVQPMQIMVVSTVAHVAGGALVLASSVVLTIQSRRMIAFTPLARLLSTLMARR